MHGITRGGISELRHHSCQKLELTECWELASKEEPFFSRLVAAAEEDMVIDVGAGMGGIGHSK